MQVELYQGTGTTPLEPYFPSCQSNFTYRPTVLKLIDRLVLRPLELYVLIVWNHEIYRTSIRLKSQRLLTGCSHPKTLLLVDATPVLLQWFQTVMEGANPESYTVVV